jgi:1,4-dihydroxy-2-naphthoate octaprenyltransferase
MFKKVGFLLNASRAYALPMSFFSWLVIFSYGLKNNGNMFYGVLALVGICFVHLACNIVDDVYDYYRLRKGNCKELLFLPNSQNGKCEYILSGKLKSADVLGLACLYLLIALIIGIFFSVYVGKTVLWFMAFGGLIALLYPIFSYIALSEVCVGLCYGPLMFGGVYYVMCGKIQPEPFILCIPTMLLCVNLLFTDTFMDREIDFNEGKKTLCGLFKSPYNALMFQKILLLSVFLSMYLLGIYEIGDWEIFFTFITIPLSVDLINSEVLNIKGEIPDKKWYHFPFENWNNIISNNSENFMFRMYQARNLMIYFSLILSFALFLF